MLDVYQATRFRRILVLPLHKQRLPCCGMLNATMRLKVLNKIVGEALNGEAKSNTVVSDEV